ncbi:MAG: hypothetical protein HC806_08955 [Anaerolineae bacterium]|nr:hypothetical protein [Anaerolineae bacterium]
MNEENPIRLIEELALHAWPAEVTEQLDGWQIRWHPMTSRRVNSVWPNAWGGDIPLGMKLNKVEMYYGLRGQPARYQICPAAIPAGLDDVLEARGYSVDAVTAVQVAEIVDVMDRSAHTFLEGKIKMFETLEEEWLEGYCRIKAHLPINVPFRRVALGRVRQPSIYVCVNVDGQATAVGRGWSNAVGWGCLACPPISIFEEEDWRPQCFKAWQNGEKK